MSPEQALKEYFDDIVAAAAADTVFDGVEVHPDFYQPVTGLKGIRIGDATSDIGPRNATYKEFNIILPIQFFYRVDENDHVEAREAVRAIQIAAAGKLYDDPSLGGEVCDVQIIEGSARRGWAKIQTTRYAAAAFLVVVDPKGFRNK